MEKSLAKFIFVLKKKFKFTLIFSFILLALVLFVIFVNKLNYLNEKTIGTYHIISNFINEDNGSVYNFIELKSALLFSDRHTNDRENSIEIYRKNNQDTAYKKIYFLNTSHLNNNSNYIFNISDKNKIIIDDFNLIFASSKIIDSRNKDYMIVIYESLFEGSVVIYYVLAIYLVILSVLFVFVYFVSEFYYLTRVNSCIALLRHEVESLFNIVLESDYPKSIKSFLIERLSRSSLSIIDFYSPVYTDSNSIDQIFKNIKSNIYRYNNKNQEKEIAIDYLKYNGTYKIPSQILYSVLFNLIDNAFSESVNASYVFIEASEDVNFNLSISVSNDGKMIDENVQKKLFKEKVTKNKKDGKGYGLYESYRSLKKYGGTLSLLESDESGTIFHIEIKCKRRHGYFYKVKKLLKVVKKKIIVIEDEAFYIEKLKKFVHKIEIVHCISADDFFKKQNEGCFGNLDDYHIIFDYYFSRGATYDTEKVYDKLRKMNFKNKIIVYSAAADPKEKYDLFVLKSDRGFAELAEFLSDS